MMNSGGNNDHAMMMREDMVDRLAKIEFANPVCADCPNQRPRWASFLKDKQNDSNHGDEDAAEQPAPERERLQVGGYLGVMVCDDCAIKHHAELGNKRCMIKCLECFHEWTHEEADIILNSGNTLVNGLYESHLEEMGDFDKEVVVDDNSEVEENRRSRFIKNKYKKCKYRNDDALKTTLQRLQNPNACAKLRVNRTNTWSSEITEKVGNNSPKPKSKKSFLSLWATKSNNGTSNYSSNSNDTHRISSPFVYRGHRVSKATKAMTAFSNSYYSADSAPRKPDRCLSASTSSGYQPSNSISDITWSEGRSGYSVSSERCDSELGSLTSWWEVH